MVLRVATENQNMDPKPDVFAKLLGDFGKWQLLIFSSMLFVKAASGWVQMTILFLTPKTVFWCVAFQGNVSKVIENSTCYADCVKYEYDSSPMESTIVSEWDLVCERQWLASFTQTVLQFGVLIGSVAFGFLADRFGRRIPFLISVTTLIAVGFAIPFSPNYTVFTTLRFFLGFATAGTMVISFVIVMESTSSRYREIIGCLYQIPFIIGHMTVPLFAYFFRTWQDYSLALAVPTALYLGYFFLVSESPRWLVSVGRVEEATKIVTKAALFNNLPTSNIQDVLTKQANESSTATVEKANFADLLRGPLRLKTLVSCVMWMIMGLLFLGFNQYISQTSPNPFISVAVAGAIQIPSNLITMVVIKKFGRKATVAVSFSLAGVCVLTLGIVSKTYWVTLTLGSLGVGFAAIVATSLYIYASELFPTVVRNMGMGSCSMSMRVGSMIAPFISNLSMTVPWLPTLVFGLSSIFAGLLCLCLPETKGVSLPDKIEDVNNT